MVRGEFGADKNILSLVGFICWTRFILLKGCGLGSNKFDVGLWEFWAWIIDLYETLWTRLLCSLTNEIIHKDHSCQF